MCPPGKTIVDCVLLTAVCRALLTVVYHAVCLAVMYHLCAGEGSDRSGRLLAFKMAQTQARLLQGCQACEAHKEVQVTLLEVRCAWCPCGFVGVH